VQCGLTALGWIQTRSDVGSNPAKAFGYTLRPPVDLSMGAIRSQGALLCPQLPIVMPGQGITID